jgi:phosphodiesterase/alkaline phosphatase D-like protein
MLSACYQVDETAALYDWCWSHEWVGDRHSVPRRVNAQPKFSAYPFSLGVASGDPLPDSVVLWTRVAPEPLAEGGGMPQQNLRVQVASCEG